METRIAEMLMASMVSKDRVLNRTLKKKKASSLPFFQGGDPGMMISIPASLCNLWRSVDLCGGLQRMA